MDIRIFGYFDEPGQTKPKYSPSTDLPCPVCSETLGDGPRKSVSFLVPGDYRCFFYRMHDACADDTEAQSRIEGEFIDLRVKELETAGVELKDIAATEDGEVFLVPKKG
jgi:hypothetical protein